MDGSVLFTTLDGNRITLVKLLVCFVQLILSVLIMMLNGIVLDTMINQGEFSETTDLLVAGLALSDFLTGISIIWIVIYNIVNFQDFNECLVRIGLAHAFKFAGVLHLLYLTVDRVLKIHGPYRYDSICQKRTAVIATAIAWLVSGILGVLPILGWNGRYQHKVTQECAYFEVLDKNYLKLLMSLITTITLLIVFLYIKLFFIARKHAKCIAAMCIVSGSDSPTVRQFRISNHTWRYTKTVMVLVGIHIVAWVPLGVVISSAVEGNLDDYDVEYKGNLILYTTTLLFLNSLLNPLVYAVKIPAIRARYRAIFCRTYEPTSTSRLSMEERKSVSNHGPCPQHRQNS